MTGIKGRSGKATTLEAKRAKAAGGAKGGRGRSSAPALPPSGATDPKSDDPVKRLGKPLTWGDELKRQQVEGERIQNLRRQVEVRRAEVELATATDKANEASGKLRSLEWIRARDEAWNAATDDRLNLVERLLDQVDGITPDQRKAFLTVARAWRLETKRILASVHA